MLYNCYVPFLSIEILRIRETSARGSIDNISLFSASFFLPFTTFDSLSTLPHSETSVLDSSWSRSEERVQTTKRMDSSHVFRTFFSTKPMFRVTDVRRRKQIRFEPMAASELPISLQSVEVADRFIYLVTRSVLDEPDDLSVSSSLLINQTPRKLFLRSFPGFSIDLPFIVSHHETGKCTMQLVPSRHNPKGNRAIDRSVNQSINQSDPCFEVCVIELERFHVSSNLIKRTNE